MRLNAVECRLRYRARLQGYTARLVRTYQGEGLVPRIGSLLRRDEGFCGGVLLINKQLLQVTLRNSVFRGEPRAVHVLQNAMLQLTDFGAVFVFTV